jgi:predicted nuclease of predicted toxin-antitoxin system
VRLKLDENLGAYCAELFRSAGHDIATVPEQDLCSSKDTKILEVCRAEERCLVTLDLEFGNPLIFNPAETQGIAVLRLPPKSTFQDLVDNVRTLIEGLARKEIKGHLWIIQRGRLREYQPKENEKV